VEGQPVAGRVPACAELIAGAFVSLEVWQDNDGLDRHIILHQQGARALESGDVLAAVDALLEVTSLRPDSASGHLDLGRAWLALGQPEEAAASLHRAFELAPDTAETCFYLGCALQAQQRMEEALLYFRQAVQLQPDSAEARNNLGTALAVLGGAYIFGLATGHGGLVREPDEGAIAHIWQLLMAGQMPVLAFFAIKWLPRSPREALRVLAVQILAALAALAPVFYLKL